MKNTKTKKSLSILLALIMIVSVVTIGYVNAGAYTAHSQAEAVAWARAWVQSPYDYDGAYGVQCVDLILAYYNYLGVPTASGNACDYATNTLPNGWQRIPYSSGFVPQPGDIAVWTYASSSNGHVAVVISATSSNMYVAETNGSTHTGRENTYSYSYGTLWGFIRPDFSSSSGNIPQGIVDEVSGETGRIHVRGWAFDSDNSSASLTIHVYIGGPAGSSTGYCYPIYANKLREDVNQAYGISGNHGFDEYIYTPLSGSQPVYIYALNIGSGNENPQIGSGTASITKDSTNPIISNVMVSNINSSGYTVTCTVTDNVMVDRVQFPTWTLKNDQDDLFSDWTTGTKARGVANGNTYTYYVKASDHNNETGYYCTHIYAYDKSGNSVCYKIDENILVHDHSYTWVVDKEATCTASGTRHQHCTICGYDTEKSSYSALGHSWNSPTYSWSSDYSKCTATRVCSRDSSHKETETVNSTSVTTESTYEKTGKIVYTAKFSNSAFSTQTKTVTLPVKMFPDVAESAWYFTAVQYNAERGYITGYSNGKFGPADNLKRQDFVVILARIAGADLTSYKNSTGGLKDVVKGSYYAPAVAWAVENEIVTGYANGKFGVGDNITREQVATILYRYMGEPTITATTRNSVLSPYADKDKISPYALNAMAWAVKNGVINGKNATTLAPTATASRAEIATIVMRMDKAGMFAA